MPKSGDGPRDSTCQCQTATRRDQDRTTPGLGDGCRQESCCLMFARICHAVRQARHRRKCRGLMDIFGVDELQADRMIAGSVNLGTFVYHDAGFSEDAWPMVVVGRLLSEKWSREDDCWRYDFSRFRRRLLLDCEERWLLHESSFLASPDAPRVDVCETIDRMEVKAVEADGTRTLVIRVCPSRRRDFRLVLDMPTVLLEAIASRLNRLWMAGKSPEDPVLPPRKNLLYSTWERLDRQQSETLRTHARRILEAGGHRNTHADR